MEHREVQLAGDFSSHRASRHLPPASLGQYASLSFVVIGRGQKVDFRLQIGDRQNRPSRLNWLNDLPLTV